MAKNNKYTSINFNHIYEKTITNNNNTTSSSSSSNPAPKSTNPSSFSASYSAVSAPNKPHGRILVLTRSTPKPINPPAQPSKQPHHPSPIQTVPDQPRSEPGSDAISLRPLGRTGTGSVLSGPSLAAHEKELPLTSPKPNKFVPPHLRPGFVPKEGVQPGPDAGHRRAGHIGSQGRFGEDERPKSGGYERIRRVGGSEMGIMGRPRSSGNRPNSSG